MSSSIAIGMVGYKFMGKAHSNAYRQISQFFDLPLQPRLKTICGREKAKVEKMASRWGWENAVTDWRAIVDDPEIRVVDICSPTTRITTSPSPPSKPVRLWPARSRSP